MTEQITYTWTGPPGVVWVQRPSLFLILLFFILSALIGSMLTSAIFVDDRRDPPEFSYEEKHRSYVMQSMEPMTIRLRVVSQAQFARERMSSNVIAFSRPTSNPCEITIPEGWMIIASPSTGYAEFARRDNGNTLAHEILHCLRNDWHPDWPPTTAEKK